MLPAEAVLPFKISLVGSFTISSLEIFLFLLDLVLPSYEALVFNLGNSSPSFSMAFEGRKNQHSAYFISRYPHPSTVSGPLLRSGFPNHEGRWVASGLNPCLAIECILKPLL